MQRDQRPCDGGGGCSGTKAKHDSKRRDGRSPGASLTAEAGLSANCAQTATPQNKQAHKIVAKELQLRTLAQEIFQPNETKLKARLVSPPPKRRVLVPETTKRSAPGQPLRTHLRSLEKKQRRPQSRHSTFPNTQRARRLRPPTRFSYLQAARRRRGAGCLLPSLAQGLREGRDRELQGTWQTVGV